MKLKYIIDKNYDRHFLNMSNLVVRKNFDNIYKNSLKYLKYTRDLYQKSWDEINNDFSGYLEKQTNYNWYYPTYYCIVSIANQGISNWGHEPKIIRGWNENPYSQRRITAHELILSHYFEIYKRNYSRYKLSDNQVWTLAEIAAFALTSLPKEVKKFWPWDFSGYYTNHNYPQIVSLQKKLKTVFLNKKNFDEYIVAGIKFVKIYSNKKLS